MNDSLEMTDGGHDKSYEYTVFPNDIQDKKNEMDLINVLHFFTIRSYHFEIYIICSYK